MFLLNVINLVKFNIVVISVIIWSVKILFIHNGNKIDKAMSESSGNTALSQ